MNRSVQPSISLHKCVRRWRTQSYSFDVVTKHVEPCQGNFYEIFSHSFQLGHNQSAVLIDIANLRRILEVIWTIGSSGEYNAFETTKIDWIAFHSRHWGLVQKLCPATPL